MPSNPIPLTDLTDGELNQLRELHYDLLTKMVEENRRPVRAFINLIEEVLLKRQRPDINIHLSSTLH
jgi:hypothetical protein